ncbi:CPBP family glutamic-type intramembrane protease [Actinoplanes sp. CA-054009]
MLAEVLVVALVIALLSDVVTNLLRPGRAMARIVARPDGRVWFYRRFLIGGWALAVLALLPVVDSDDLTRADLGLTWSGGGVAGPAPSFAPALAWVLTAFLLLVLVTSGNRLRRHVLSGGTVPTRDKAAPMFPRTPRERGLATAVAITAGITEEIVFRGLLVAAGVVLFDLPLVAACTLSIVLFAATHLYQGAQGVYGAAALAVAFTGITVLSGTLLPAIVLHVIVDLIAFLHIPPPPLHPSPAEAHLPATQPEAPQSPTQPEATQPPALPEPPQPPTQLVAPRPGAPTGARPASPAAEVGAMSRTELAAALANAHTVETQPTTPPTNAHAVKAQPTTPPTNTHAIKAQPTTSPTNTHAIKAQPTTSPTNTHAIKAQPSAARTTMTAEADPPSMVQLAASLTQSQANEAQPATTPLEAPPPSPAAEAGPPTNGQVADRPTSNADALANDQVADGQTPSPAAEGQTASPAAEGQTASPAASALPGGRLAAGGAGARNVPVVPGAASVGPMVPKLRRPAPGA